MTVKLFHDPGHGGASLGCQRGGVIEKDLVLSISRDVDHFLRLWPYMDQIQSRDNDETRRYSRRAEQAKGWGADLVMCYHADARVDADGHDDTRASGVTCYVLEGNTVAFEVAKKMLDASPAGLDAVKMLPFTAKPKPHWTSRAYSILSLYDPIPAILIETGFLTNSYDRAALTDLSNRPAIGAMVMCGVTRFMQLRDKQPRR